jgi:hypothetical protein
MKHFQLTLMIFASFAIPSALAGQTPAPTTNDTGGVFTLVGMPSNARSLMSDKSIVVLYGNKFRYDLGPQTTQAPIGSAAVPGALGLSSTQIANLPNIVGQPGGGAAGSVIATGAAPGGAPVIPGYPDACNQSDTLGIWPTAVADRIKRISNCWTGIRGAIDNDQKALAALREAINKSIRKAATEQRCYVQQIWLYRQPILLPAQALSLIDLALANATPDNANGCYQANADTWPLDSADGLGIDLVKQQQALADLATAPGYPDWANQSGVQTANSTLVKQVGDFITEANSYSTGTAAAGAGSVIAQTYSDFQTVVANNKQWRAQLSNLLDANGAKFSLDPLSPLRVDVSLDPCREWYGKGRTDTVKLHAVDLSSTAAASQDISLATNTCNPRTIASTGIGVSFLASPTYAFVASDNTGAQVIGETATNKQSPLYAVLYNIQIADFKRGIELFASPGVGLTSSSQTTNGDFLGGMSLSFARRVLFVTPSVDFGRRDQLAHGFKLSDPKGSLTSVPTQSHWPVGFMISVSFGIGPS